jgi:hypothetical protein
VKTRLAILCGLVLAQLAAAPPSRDDVDPEPPYFTKRYSSPQTCFDAYAKASDKGDHKTAFDCLSPEAQKDTAAFTVYTMLSIKDNVPEEFKKTFKPVFDVMAKHGLTDKALKDFKADVNVMKMPEKTRLGLRKLIKKPLALMLDLSAAQEKVQKEGGFGLPAPQVKPKTTLSDLKTKGDKASGTMVVSYGGFETKQAVDFVKLNVGWKMVPSLEFVGSGVAPNAPQVEKEGKQEKARRR